MAVDQRMTNYARKRESLVALQHKIILNLHRIVIACSSFIETFEVYFCSECKGILVTFIHVHVACKT